MRGNQGIPVPVVIKQPEPVAPVPEIPEQEEVRFNFTVFGTEKKVMKPFISYISENAFSKLSDHDLQRFDEKYV